MDGHRRQHAEAAAVLQAALLYLNRGGVCREPLSPGMFARPNLKGLQAVLHLLYHRIRGAARAKKELQHVFPVLEPAQAREFKAAMQAWVRELGAAGAVGPDTVRFFVSAYQGSSSHRTVLMLLDLSALALAKDLGAAGPHSTLPGIESLQPSAAGQPGSCQSAAAAAALRQGRARMDAIVAAMQRLKQLHTQAVGQMAGGQAASGAAAQELAPRVPHLFAGSQAATRRGELVQELLAQGPQLTGMPEVVGPDSWADLLAQGRAAAPAPAGAAAGAPSQARRLSNPAQEASQFAAEGLAADADVLSLQQVLVRRLAAAGAALQPAVDAGAALGSAEVRSALAEAAACREALTLSLRQELAAAKLRAELQAPSSTSSGTSTAKPSMLQLLPPPAPPANPVLAGMQAAQEAGAAMPGEPGSSSGGWEPLKAEAVEGLRRRMWQQALGGGGQGAAEGAAAAEGEAIAAANTEQAAAADGSRGSEAGGAGQEPVPAAGRAAHRMPAVASPSLEQVVSLGSRGLAAGAQLLSDETAEELQPAPGFHSPSASRQQKAAWAEPDEQLGGLSPALHGQRAEGEDEEEGGEVEAWPPSREFLQQLGLPPDSPCMAESCASVSVVGDSHRGGSQTGSAAAAVAAARQQQRAAAGRGRPRPLAASPMVSAAASFMPSRLQPRDWQQQQQERRHQPAVSSAALQQDSASPLPAAHVSDTASGDACSSPAGSTPVPAGRSGSGSGPGMGRSASTRRAGRVSFTLTPPRLLADSPLPGQQQRQERQQQQQQQQPGPSAGGDLTPESRRTPLPPPTALHPIQAAQTQRQAPPPSPDLLASCFKSQPEGEGLQASSPFASPLFNSSHGTPSPPAWPQPSLAQAAQEEGKGGTQQQQQQHAAKWAAAVARSESPSGSSPGGSGGLSRRRSAVHTTSSPSCRGSQEQGSPSLSAATQLTPPRSLLVTPEGPGRASRLQVATTSAATSLPAGSSKAGAAAAGDAKGSQLDSLRQRMMQLTKGGR